MTVEDFARSRGFSAQRTRWLGEQCEQPSTQSRKIVELVPTGTRAVGVGGGDDGSGAPCVEPLQAPKGEVGGAAPRLGLQILCPSGHVVVVNGGELTATLTAALRALREAGC